MAEKKKDPGWVCPVCGDSFQSAEALEVHINAVHR